MQITQSRLVYLCLWCCIACVAACAESASQKINRINVQREAVMHDKSHVDAMNALLQLAADADPRVAANAMLALGTLSRNGVDIPPQGLELLNEALDSPISVLRRNAALALTFFGPKAHSSVPFLLRSLKDSNSDVAVFSANALGAIHTLPDQVIPALLNAAKKRIPNGVPAMETRAAIVALSHFGDAIRPYLQKLENIYMEGELGADVQSELLVIIATVAPDSSITVRGISELYKSNIAIARINAIKALRNLPPEKRSDELMKIIETARHDPIPAIREMADKL